MNRVFSESYEGREKEVTNGMVYLDGAVTEGEGREMFRAKWSV